MAANTRAVAARVLGEVLDGKSLNQVLPAALDRVSPRDRALLQHLCYGSLRRGPQLQALLDQMLGKPLKRRDNDVLGLLLCGLYQLEDTRIPDHAAVAETVDATRVLKKPWARSMANAILRRYLREREQLLAKLDEAAASAHPGWLFRELQQQWPDSSEQIIAANNSQPPMVLRINELQQSRAAYLEKLAANGIEARPGTVSPLAVYLAQALDVNDLPGFTSGEVSVQDEAAQLAAILLQAAPGERVLDACAAPGGKSCHILEGQPQLGQLLALDVDEQRLEKVAENLQRLELKAELLAADAAHPPAQLAVGSFDRILVDAPCSASGVIRRHPDVKLLRRETDLVSLANQQLAILQGTWSLLKPGGSLLYATCSVLAQENDGVVNQFLQYQGDARLDNEHCDWGHATDTGRQLLPTEGGPDGLFYARLSKAG